ncbi:MAG: tRNA-specific 2-thiouridylase, partial [Candidatus Berkelbacteria bacterium Gr01-1014_85]
DQSYFLYRVAHRQWSRVLFPLSQLTKAEVRQLASQLGLSNAKRSDSMGICFVGKVAYRQFISLWLPEAEGPIVDLEGRVLGQHQGIHLYTIGEHVAIDGRRFAAAYPEQRGALPSYYVQAKQPDARRLIVAPGADHPTLMSDQLTLSPATPDLWSELELAKQSGATFYLRIRHLGQLYTVASFEQNQWQSPSGWQLTDWEGPAITFNLTERARAVAPGQHAVIYASWPTEAQRPKAVIGGGMILPDAIIKR